MRKELLVASALAYLLYRLNAKTSTKKIEGENAVSELRMIPINGTELAVMIRGTDKNNPVLLCVTGGPAGSEIPLIRKYEKELEKHFTIVHYDQRGAGKSFSFKEDYRDINYHQHVDDLIALTEYVREYLNKDKVYIMGHSYGTYLGSLAVNEKPEYYKAYIGIGQMFEVIHRRIGIIGICRIAHRQDNLICIRSVPLACLLADFLAHELWRARMNDRHELVAACAIGLPFLPD